MLKILFTVAVLAAIYFIFFKKPKQQKKSSKELEDMIECEKCGTYISENEAYESGGELYCSKECLK